MTERRHLRKFSERPGPSTGGFTLLETVAVLAIVLIVLAGTLPSLMTMLQSYRLIADANGIASQLALARMRAASDFTWARLSFSLAANSYQIEIYNKLAGQYQLEGGPQYLSSGNFFGYGSLTTPAGGQSTIQQTSLIAFNSRGMSIDSSGTPTSSDAIYLSNGPSFICAVTVAANGRPTVWEYAGKAWQSR